MKVMLTRLAHMNQYAGRWGKCLSAALLLGWAVGVLVGSPWAVDFPPIRDVADTFGTLPTGLCLMTVVLFPIVAVALDSVLMRFASTTLLLTVWAFFVIETSVEWMGYRPALSTALVGFIGAANADWRLLSRLRSGVGGES